MLIIILSFILLWFLVEYLPNKTNSKLFNGDRYKLLIIITWFILLFIGLAFFDKTSTDEYNDGANLPYTYPEYFE